MSANRKEEVGKKYCERKKKQNTEKNWAKIRSQNCNNLGQKSYFL